MSTDDIDNPRNYNSFEPLNFCKISEQDLEQGSRKDQVTRIEQNNLKYYRL